MEFLFTKTPLLFFVQNLWRDEAFTVLLSQQNIGEIFRTTAIDFNPPLYYVFMHYWMLIFGSSEIAVRTVSLLFFILTLFILFEMMVLILKIPFKRSLLYFSLILLNPLLLTYAFEARMYMMAAFFVTLSYFAQLTGRSKLYIVAITLALYTHYFTILILIAQIIGMTNGSTIKKVLKRVRHGNLTAIINHLPSTAFLPILLFLPWLLFLYTFHDFHTSDFWILPSSMQDLWYLPFVLFTGYQRVFGLYYHGQAGYTAFHLDMNILIWGILFLPLAVFTASIIRSTSTHKMPRVLQNRSRKYLLQYGIPLILWTVVPPLALFVISYFFTPVYHPRYFMFSIGGMMLLIILSIELVFFQKQKALFPYKSIRIMHIHIYPLTIQKSIGVCICILLLLVSSKYNEKNLKYNAKRTVSPLFREIDRSMHAGDRVYLTRDLDYFLAKYYMTTDAIYIVGTPYEEIKTYVGKVLIPPTATSISQIPTYPARTFFVYYDRYVVRSEL